LHSKKKRRLKYFLLQHIFYSADEYVLLGSTVTQLCIIMYILFLVFSNFTTQDPKNYILMCELNYILRY